MALERSYKFFPKELLIVKMYHCSSKGPPAIEHFPGSKSLPGVKYGNIMKYKSEKKAFKDRIN